MQKIDKILFALIALVLVLSWIAIFYRSNANPVPTFTTKDALKAIEISAHDDIS